MKLKLNNKLFYKFSTIEILEKTFLGLSASAYFKASPEVQA